MSPIFNVGFLRRPLFFCTRAKKYASTTFSPLPFSFDYGALIEIKNKKRRDYAKNLRAGTKQNTNIFSILAYSKLLTFTV